ncbi:MAG TPA: hypothetical protein VH583_25155 [Vicinamibacterales bacterium]|jgi:hypothetical protein
MTRPRAVLLGTFVVGTLDALDAVVYFNASAIRIFQSIARGLLGRDAFRGGLPVAALGMAIHYFIAFSIVSVYMAASRKWPVLTQRPVVCGALYGIGVYFFMNLVVIPLSAVGFQPFTRGPFLNGIFIHVFGIGLPSAFVSVAAARTESPQAV